MAKINYRTCDVCGNILKTDIRCRGYLNGWRIWNKVFNSLDICSDCMRKIRYLSIDKKHEEEYMSECFKNEKKYDDPNLQIAYSEGLDDAFRVLSHHRLEKIK